MSLIRAVRSFSRLRQIVNILFKEGFEEIIEELRFKSHLPIENQIGMTKEKRKKYDPRAVRLKRAMEEAGGAFIKLAQMLSLRSDLIPIEYCEEFSKLQDSVQSFPYSQVKKIIEEDFGKPIHRVFKEFDKTPIAAASVSQVHKAKLLSGVTVAVKVQRPHIKQVFQSDIDILFYLAEQAEKYSKDVKQFHPTKIVKEFEKYTQDELDFTQEAKNIQVFYEKYKYSPHIRIPAVHWDYTSNRVITMKFIEGQKVSSIKDMSEKEKKRVTLLIFKSFIEQVFNMHVFHADPHPGNIFIEKDGKIAFLDFGIVGRISPDMAQQVELMMVGLVKGDLETLAESFIGLGAMKEDVDLDRFKEDLFEAWAQYHGSSLKEINMGSFFSNSFDLARKYNVEYPGSFVLLTKAVITTEGIGRQLYPQANFVEVCSPIVERILLKQRSPEKIAKGFERSAISWAGALKKFPQDLRTIMYILKHGAKVKLDVDHKELNQLTLEMDRSSNRITFGLLIGGLIIAAGLITVAGVPPIIWGIPLLAWLAIGICFMLSFALMISMMRENKGGE